MAITPAVFRVINYGGERSDSMRGGTAVEHFAVVGLGADEFEAAYGIGLPKKGALHVNANLSFVGSVQSVKQVAELGPALWIARVTYSQNGTFYFATRLSARTRFEIETMDLPILTEISGNTNEQQFVVREPRITVQRHAFFVSFTNITGMSARSIRNFLASNVKKTVFLDNYTDPFIGSIRYQLVGANLVEDAGQNKRIDTFFIHRTGLPEYPVQTFSNQSVTIPKLPPNAEYDVDVLAGEITVTDPLEVYGEAATIPWL